VRAFKQAVNFLKKMHWRAWSANAASANDLCDFLGGSLQSPADPKDQKFFAELFFKKATAYF
jgi:hypothetical protein